MDNTEFKLSGCAALAVSIGDADKLITLGSGNAALLYIYALRAGGDAKFTMTVSMISMWLFRVLACYVFVLHMHMGLFGVWLGMYIDWVCRMLCFVLRFAGRKWMDHKVI